ncbi:bifunctional peptidase and arginyl-hydroxylase JMJD5-like isoform X1 [Apis cerana]|uniref:bifunctional peptidase and arginyl-hydroxylase JMJD5-like isoform X1 n=2 Tax=Apis cerana TaxID=7461 RepID=UPI002B2274E9|nr:bifunctional peptidase and arginyl-hydroxylase JMJD5-like isoform X1 [Apis cerana]
MCNCTIIAKLIPWNLFDENMQNFLPIEMKKHLVTININLKLFIENKITSSMKWTKDSLILIEACLDKTWEALNSGHWQSVPIEYRYSYTLCTILKTILLEFQYYNNIEEFSKNIILLKDIIQQIDKGILLGAPLPNIPDLLPKIARELNNCITKSTEILDLKKLNIDFKNSYDFILPGFIEVTQYIEPSMELFYKEIFMPKIPAILKDCIKHWKALKQWKDLKYLINVAGNRLVPIEIGSRYTDENWSQQLLNFSEFLQKYILTKNDQIGYLAQHQLFEQIPELKDDFTIPEYCNFTDNDDVKQPDINVWFGPSGTVSPLHFDPKNNFLCQVFGYKKIILYHPNDSSNLYPYDTRLLNNTAQVDPLSPNYEKWPNFIKARGLMTYLKPGEMLYIPPKWWHHVTSLTSSFSVSFWWS